MVKQLLLCLLFFTSLTSYTQNITITGYVRDMASGGELVGANVYDLNSKKGTATDEDGFYSLSVPAGAGELVFSYIGFQTDTISWLATTMTRINCQLSKNVQLGTVKVLSDRVNRIEEESQTSKHIISAEQLKKIPAILGETDFLKSLQLMPGVQSGTEATPGLFVRGGSMDQNLILVEEVPIYNPSHVLGLFSSFNADAIKSVSISKGGFPARFGGRLSSVVEVDMREGDLNEFHGTGQIGLISSRLLFEGPIIPEKSSFLVSLRRSYTDLIARPVLELTQSSSGGKVLPTAFFQDINVALNHRFNEKNRLEINGYFGADQYGVKLSDEIEATDASVSWDNYLGSLNWNHQISPRLFTNATLTYSRYHLDNNVEYSFFKNDEQDFINSIYYSGINDIGLKYSFDFMPSHQHSLKMGMEWTHHIYSPGALTYGYLLEGEKVSQDYSQKKLYSQERSFFLEDDMEFGHLKMNAGFHFSQFFTDGKLYYSLQPRLSARYMFPGKWALKISYAQMQQYVNLLTSESLSLPSDLWVPSTGQIQPQTSWQGVVGVAKTLWNDYEFSVEGYYKEMNHVLSYQPGISFVLEVASSDDWQDKIDQGRGWAYGAELLFQKKFGKTTGWLAYTLSWNYRQFDKINHGEKFPFKYDRRHDISAVISHDLSDQWSFSGTWIYGTGNAYSIPDTYYPGSPGKFEYLGGHSVYSKKNNYRMSDYHRLDISGTRTSKRKWGETFWTFGAYNTYFRKNPFYIMQQRDGTVKEVAILPIIPYISWGFKF